MLQFDYDDVRWNLLDTPGHNDFSEDTYRTLMAADCANHDSRRSASGVEPQTRKLFHVCRMRNTPVVTFINKMDRPARDAFALMSQVEEVLGVEHGAIHLARSGAVTSFKESTTGSRTKLVIRFERSSRKARRSAQR